VAGRDGSCPGQARRARPKAVRLDYPAWHPPGREAGCGLGLRGTMLGLILTSEQANARCTAETLQRQPAPVPIRCLAKSELADRLVFRA
jgi:hypothetical protein